MTFLSLPLRQDALVFTFFVPLSNVNFFFRFYFNQNESSWYFDLADESLEPIATGVKVVLGTSLIGHVTDPRRPIGPLLAVALFAPLHEDAGVADLGLRVKIFYNDPLPQTSSL